MIITQQIAAGSWFEFSEQGDFFRILTDSGSTDFDVEFYSSGKEIVDAYAVKAGYSERFIGSTFDRVRIRSTVNTTVQFVMRLGNVVGYDVAPTGNVSGTVAVNGFSGSGVVLSQEVFTVGTVSVSLANARPGRKYLLVQNKDAVGSLWLRLDGAVATVLNGIYLGPGDSYEMSIFCSNSEIRAIGDIASNSSVIVVEA